MLKHEQILMKTAAEVLDEEKSRLRLTTGSGDLDSFIGGIEEGLFYLFYGEQEILDSLIHRLLVNCVLQQEKGGFEAKGIYFNNTNYYTGKTILNPSELGGLAKHIGVDPMDVLKNIRVAAAYNEQRQLIVAKEIADAIGDDPDIKLLAAHNITRFFSDSKKPEKTREVLKQVVSHLWNTSSARRTAFVATADETPTGRGFISRPVGGNLLRHVANIIVHFRKLYDGPVSSVKATLVKHPYRKTPDSIVLLISKGGMDLMGRMTPSFRQIYDELISNLKTNFQNSLIDLGHKQAFDLLLKEAWGAEQAAMSQSNPPTVLDALNITANVHNRKLIEALAKKLKERDETLEKLRSEVDELRARLEGGVKVARDDG